jgi:Phytanoyl-CoA dioxygenase (PhyH)
VLSADDLDDFMERGYVRVPSAFAPAVAQRCRALAVDQLSIDPYEPANWSSPVVRGLVEGDALREAANSPALVEAVGQLLDPEPWQRRPNLGAFVVRFPSQVEPGDTGWHIDSSFQPPGDSRWFVNYRSRQRGLLMLCLLSDVGVSDAPTRILPGSQLEMAKLLYPAGDAGLPGAYAGQASEIPLPDSSGPVEVATGEAGDVFLCHPFLVHAAGWPHPESRPRFIAQPPISLTGSLQVDGPDARLCLVARSIKRGIASYRRQRIPWAPDPIRESR